MTKHRRHDRAKHNAMLKREWMKLYVTEPHGERRAAEAMADAFIAMSRQAREAEEPAQDDGQIALPLPDP